MKNSKLFEEESLLPISALQHLLFCERQWGLIHLEQIWLDNHLTMEGNYLHQKVDIPSAERRNSIKIVRSLKIRSLQYGIAGIADVVEFHPQQGGVQIPYPIEYKRGKPKETDIDIVQLCAQVLCLEEMLGIPIQNGAFYYDEIKRRKEINISAEIRNATIELIERMHKLYKEQKTPPAKFSKACFQCSLIHHCMPQTTCGEKSCLTFVEKSIETLMLDEFQTL